MSQNPLMYTSGTQFSKTPSLKPALAAALASLEVQLDRELARYRRTRSYRTPHQSNLGSTITANNQLQYLTPATVDIYENTTQPVAEENQPHIDTVQTKIGDSLAVNVYEAQNQYQIANQEIPVSEANTASTSIPDVTTSSLPLPPPPPPHTPKFASASTEETPTSTPTKPNTISIVPATAKVTDGSKPNTEASDTQLDDYLESSEALLRSLAEEPPKEQKRPNRNDSLLSPLGIGSMLLLLVASLIFGYQVLKFGEYGASKGNNSTAENSQIGTNTTARNVAEPLQTAIPKYPNLAKDEFPEVNDPNDVVGLKPKAKPTPTIAPPTPVQNPVAINPIQQVPVNPTPAAATITPPVAVTPTPEIPLSSIKPSTDGFYHVVIDNSSEDTFAKARKTIPDAYLSPDKKMIFLGALKNKEKAQELLVEIKGKGINARIQQP
jgi:cell division septation protein DedD